MHGQQNVKYSGSDYNNNYKNNYIIIIIINTLLG